MGRQTRFFMEREKEEEFIKFAFKEGFYVIDENMNEKKVYIYKTYEEYKLSCKCTSLYLYKEEYNKIEKFQNSCFINDTLSFVIEYNKIEKFQNSCFINDTLSFVIEFSKTCYSTYDNGDIGIRMGRIWFEYKYYDDNGNLVIKDEQLLKDYNMLARWINKNAPLQEYYYGDCNTNGGCTFKEHITEKMLELNKTGKYIFF